jgi:hypothetical protein
VAAFGLSFPADTVWARRRPVAGLLAALAFAAVFWLLAGGLLQGLIVPARMTLWECLLALGQGFGHAGRRTPPPTSRWRAGSWSWPFSMAYPLATLPQPPGRVAGAIWADFGLIAAYACLLARAVTWAFARIVRLQRASHRPSALAQRAGAGRHGRRGKRRAGKPADAGAGIGLSLAVAGRGGARAGAGHDGGCAGQMGGAAGLRGAGRVGPGRQSALNSEIFNARP